MTYKLFRRRWKKDSLARSTSIDFVNGQNGFVTLYFKPLDIAFYVVDDENDTFTTGWINHYGSDYFKSEGNEGFEGNKYDGIQSIVDAIETVIGLRRDKYKEFEDECAAIDRKYNVTPLEEFTGEPKRTSEIDVLLAQ